jgi:methyltransferase (TIGR00027 family)
MHRRTRPSFTADAACGARAHGSLHRDPKLRNPDGFARQLVGMPFRALMYPMLRAAFLPIFEHRIPGVYFAHQARTHAFDSLLLREIEHGATDLVLLGAGFDSRAHRIARNLRVFEVDHPLTSTEKRRRISRVLGASADHVRYVPVDFSRESLPERLAASGYDRSARTVFLWEGVTPYLDATAVDDTLAFVASAGRGSVVAFDYVVGIDAPSTALKRQMDLAASYGEPYRFGLRPAELGPLLLRHGMKVVANLEAEEITRRYLVGSDGRIWGRPPDEIGFAIGRV